MDITFTLLITAVLSFGIAELFGRSKHIGRWWMFGLMVGAFFVPGILAYLASPHASKTPTKPSRLTSQIGIVLTVIGVVGLFPALFVDPVALSMPLAIVLIGTYLIQLGRGNVVNHAPKEYFRFQGSDYLKNQSKGIGQYLRQAVDELKTNNNMLYYLVEDGKHSEPYSYEQLKSKRIKEDALVWRKGLDTWVRASELNELSNIIAFIPPAIPETPPTIPSAASEHSEATKEDANHPHVKIELLGDKATLNVHLFRLKRSVKRLAFFASLNIVQGFLLVYVIDVLSHECSSCDYGMYAGVLIVTVFPIGFLTLLYIYKVLFNLHKCRHFVAVESMRLLSRAYLFFKPHTKST